MQRVMLTLGIGMSLLAAAGCDGPRAAMTAAARRGDIDEIKALLDGGADVNAPDAPDGWPPLFHAVVMQQAATVTFLFEHGADPNKRFDRLVPLEVAAAQHTPAMVELLLAHGADIAARGPDGSTALSVAVGGGAMTDQDLPFLGGCHPETVRALLAHDPSQRLPDTFAGHRALWFARFHGCTEVLRMITSDRAR